MPTGGYDVWHATHQDSAFVPSRRSRVILTVLDLNFLERVEYSAAKKARKLAAVQRKVDRASAIAAISAYTASVVRENLRVPDIPVEVIYLGNPLPPNGSPGAKPRSDSTLAVLEHGKPFLLFVGVLHPKKNVHTLLPALTQLPDWSLVLAGANADGDTAKSAEALAELCRTYWRPVFSYVCRHGYSPDDAQDITQDFFLMILKTNWLRQADQSRGRFRSLLLKSVQNFLHNVTDTKQTLKRGGGVDFVSWDAWMAEAP